MKNIQPITSWVNGQSVVATQINVAIDYDDLATTAIFKYKILSVDSLTVAEGKLTIAGEDYQIWGFTVDVNQSAYEWVASQLNLTIDYTTTEDPTTSTSISTTTII